MRSAGNSQLAFDLLISAHFMPPTSARRWPVTSRSLRMRIIFGSIAVLSRPFQKLLISASLRYLLLGVSGRALILAAGLASISSSSMA